MAKIKGGTKGGLNDSLFRDAIGDIVKYGDTSKTANIVEFVNASWGLGLNLTPVQQFMVKCIYGLPLDDKTPVVEVPDTLNSRIIYPAMTEMEFAKWSYEEGRCNIDFSDPNNWGRTFYNFIFAIGRRSGKCRYENDRIATTCGSITFKELLQRKNAGEKVGILTYDQKSFKQSKTYNFKIWENGIKECLKIETGTGASEVSTANHPYLIWRENEEEPRFVDLSDVQIGDRIAISQNIGLFGKGSIGKNKAKLLGYLSGDGSTTESVGFSNTDQKIIDDIQSILDKEFKGFVIRKQGDPKKYFYKIVKKEGKVGWHILNDVKEWLKQIECFGNRAINKKIPECIYKGSKEEVVSYLSALFSCDGWAAVGNKNYERKKPNAHIGFCSASYSLAYGVKHLLMKFGIHGILRYKKVKFEEKEFHAYQLEIATKKDIEIFASEIGIFSKEDSIHKVLEIVNQNRDYENRKLYSIPIGVWNWIRRIKKEKNLSNRDIVGGETYDNDRLRMRYAPNRQKIASYGLNVKDGFLVDHAYSDVYWDTVKSIELVGKKETVDLCIEDTHIIGGDIISHNSTLCSCIVDYEFYRLFKCGDPHKLYNVPPGQEIAVIGTAPTDGQAQIVFNMAKTFAQNSPIMKDRVAHPTQTYFEIQTDQDVKNFGKGREGAMQFITGGSSSNSIRGHNAIIVLIDEMAFFTEKGGRFSIGEVYGALTPSIAKFKDPETGKMDGKIICLSSPYAHFGKFYDLYRDSFSEESQRIGSTVSFRYYTALVNPENAPEEYLREERRKDRSKFRREFEAEFDERITSWIDSEVQFRNNICRPYRKEKGSRGIRYFYGFDFGSTDNGAAMAIVHKEGERYYLDYAEVFYPNLSPVWNATVCTIYKNHPECEKFRGYDVLPFFEIGEHIKELSKNFPMFLGAIDQYSGHAIYQILQSKGIDAVELRSYNESSKSRIFKLIKELYQENLMDLMDHPVLIQEMLNMEAELRPQNKIAVNKRTSSDDSFQDDITDAFVRAVWECWRYYNVDNKSAGGQKSPTMVSFGNGKVFDASANANDLTKKLRGANSLREFHRVKSNIHGIDTKRKPN